MEFYKLELKKEEHTTTFVNQFKSLKMQLANLDKDLDEKEACVVILNCVMQMIVDMSKWFSLALIFLFPHLL